MSFALNFVFWGWEILFKYILECCFQYFLWCGIKLLLVKPSAIVVWVAHLPNVQEDLGISALTIKV